MQYFLFNYLKKNKNLLFVNYLKWQILRYLFEIKIKKARDKNPR